MFAIIYMTFAVSYPPSVWKANITRCFSLSLVSQILFGLALQPHSPPSSSLAAAKHWMWPLVCMWCRCLVCVSSSSWEVLYYLSVFCVVSRVLVPPLRGLMRWLQRQVAPSCSIKQVCPESMDWKWKKINNQMKEFVALWHCKQTAAVSASPAIFESHRPFLYLTQSHPKHLPLLLFPVNW